MGSYTAMCRRSYCTLQEVVVWHFEWTWMNDNIPDLNNSYGFIRHGIRVILCTWYDELLIGMIVLDAMIRYDRSIGTRGFCAGSGKLCIIFGPAGWIRGFGPRGADTTMSLWQTAAILEMANPQAR